MMLATRRGLSFPRARPKRRIQATRTRVIRLVQPESVLHNQVVQLAEMYGWRWYHTHDSRKSPPGFPDLVLVRGDRLIFAELKTQRGRLTVDQVSWLAELQATCAEVFVWRPSDLPQIAAILRRRMRD